jgi:hypothetical protein
MWLSHPIGQVLAGPELVQFAPAYSASTGYRDLTADLLSLEVVEEEGKAARATIVLDNSAGQYVGLSALKVRAQILLSQGFVGAGLAPTHLFYVQSWQYARAVDVSEIVITAVDEGERLFCESGVPLSFSDYLIWNIVFALAAASGIEQQCTQDGSLQLSQNVVSFQLEAGKTYVSAIARLLAAWSAGWRIRVAAGNGVAFPVTDRLDLLGKTPTQGTVWTYGPEPESYSVALDGNRANHVVVHGPAKIPTAVGEAWDSTDLTNTGRERYALAVEQLAQTSGAAEYAASFALWAEQRLATAVKLSVGPNPALEMYDAIYVQDSVLPGVACRIIGLKLSYSARSQDWGLVLSCEGL